MQNVQEQIDKNTQKKFTEDYSNLTEDNIEEVIYNEVNRRGLPKLYSDKGFRENVVDILSEISRSETTFGIKGWWMVRGI